MCCAARQAQAMSPLPGANPRGGRIGRGRQVQQLESATFVRFRPLFSQTDAVVRGKLTRVHRRYGVHCGTPEVSLVLAAEPGASKARISRRRKRYFILAV